MIRRNRHETRTFSTRIVREKWTLDWDSDLIPCLVPTPTNLAQVHAFLWIYWIRILVSAWASVPESPRLPNPGCCTCWGKRRFHLETDKPAHEGLVVPGAGMTREFQWRPRWASTNDEGDARGFVAANTLGIFSQVSRVEFLQERGPQVFSRNDRSRFRVRSELIKESFIDHVYLWWNHILVVMLESIYNTPTRIASQSTYIDNGFKHYSTMLLH